ncbi:MAG: hypothetical protein D3904_11915 [Candidatus Electrothrix sp. EH2]|nr:hypothetical protein [Candidatus Electrothrix sp. EH2]
MTNFMVTQQKTDWHRLQNLIFTDFFTGSSWSVELEKDLSMKRQLLDMLNSQPVNTEEKHRRSAQC